MSICDKEGHLYRRYYCKECGAYYSRGDARYKEHANHAMNRYYCGKCGYTHISSYGAMFLRHLKYKLCEIRYFALACSVKCFYKSSFNRRLPELIAKEIAEKWRRIRQIGHTNVFSLHYDGKKVEKRERR